MAVADLLKEQEEKIKIVRFTVTFYPEKNAKDKKNVEKIDKLVVGLQKQLTDSGSTRKIAEADVIRELLDEALSQYED